MLGVELHPASWGMVRRHARSTPMDTVGLASGVSSHRCWQSSHVYADDGRRGQMLGRQPLRPVGGRDVTSRRTPVNASGLASGVAAIAAGYAYTCTLTTGGGVKCWGRNLYTLGDGTLRDSFTPVNVRGLESGVTAIAAGDYHACVLTTGGGVKCWGDNHFGQLGDGTGSDSSTPVNVNGLGSGMTAIAAGYDHTCALTAGGGVKCWGDTNFTPVDVGGLESGVTAIAAGGYGSCVLTTGGRAKCWGDGSRST